MKSCSSCQEVKPLGEFHKNKNSPDGLKDKCKDCVNAFMRDYYQQNKDKIKKAALVYHYKNQELVNEKRRLRRLRNLDHERANSRRWHQSNKDKARVYKSKNRAKRRLQKLDTQVSVQDLVRLQKRITKCFYCGIEGHLTIEHIVPLSRGGKHQIGNLTMACHKCNSSKNSKLLMEWRIYKLKL